MPGWKCMPGCLEWNHKISPIDAFYENTHTHTHFKKWGYILYRPIPPTPKVGGYIPHPPPPPPGFTPVAQNLPTPLVVIEGKVHIFTKSYAWMLTPTWFYQGISKMKRILIWSYHSLENKDFIEMFGLHFENLKLHLMWCQGRRKRGMGMHPPRFQVGDGVYNHPPPPPGFSDEKNRWK